MTVNWVRFRCNRCPEEGKWVKINFDDGIPGESCLFCEDRMYIDPYKITFDSLTYPFTWAKPTWYNRLLSRFKAWRGRS